MNEHICVAVNTKATGEKIRKLREKCGFSKTEVQESLGLVGVQSIYDWENGVKLPNLENALGLARLLGVDLDQLLVAQPLVKENATKTEQERSDRCRISEAVEKLEPMFADMLLEDGSASDPAADTEIQLEDGTWEKYHYPVPEVLAYYSVSQFRLEICNRTDSYARFYPKERRFVFSEKGLKDEALLLHEMIHMHEYALSQLPSQYRERVAACLCESLQKNIYDVDQMVKENLSFFQDSSVDREEHDTLFYLKSLALDMRMHYKLGTIYACGREHRACA